MIMVTLLSKRVSGSRGPLHLVGPWTYMSVGEIALTKLISMGSPLWAALFSRQGILSHIKVEEMS